MRNPEPIQHSTLVKMIMLAPLCQTIIATSGQVVVADAYETKRKPNLIIILTDDQGYGDLGCFGSKTIKTPRLDKLASEGLKLTSFYAQPVCGPSRAALMTGCYPMRVHGGGWRVASDEIMISKLLKPVGYETACIGKWDMSDRMYIKGEVPNDQGFNYYYGTLTATDKGRVMLMENRSDIGETREMASLTRKYTDKAIKYIREHKDKPFFLYLAHSMPHIQIDASPQFKGTSQGDLYGDVIEEMDWNVGRLIDVLQELHLDKNTIIVFTSDNGPWIGVEKEARKRHGGHQATGSAGLLRGGKGSSWEGGVREPCIIWGPGYIPAGRISSEIISTLDVLPTFAEFAGAKVPTDRVIDGRDQSKLFTGKTDKTAHDTYYYYVKTNLQAVRKGKWKLALNNRKRFYHYAKDDVPVNKPQLYDMDVDIGEKHDLAAEYPDVVADLLKLAEKVRDDLGDVKHRPGRNVRRTATEKSHEQENASQYTTELNND